MGILACTVLDIAMGSKVNGALKMLKKAIATKALFASKIFRSSIQT